jgi:hypothetical protein
VIGLASGLAFYALLHILPYPDTYRALSGLAFASTHAPPILVPDLNAWLESMLSLSTGTMYDLRVPLAVSAVIVLAGRNVLSERAVFLLLLGLMAAHLLLLRTHSMSATFVLAIPAIICLTLLVYFRRSITYRNLLIIVMILLLAFIVLVRTKLRYYMILVSPATDLLIVALVIQLMSGRKATPKWSARCIVIIFGFILASIAINLSILRIDTDPDYRLMQERVSAVIEPGSTVMGPQTYWFGLTEHHYLSWQQLVYHQRHAPGSTLRDAFSTLRPDYLIVDGHLETFVIDDLSSVTNYVRFLSIPRQDLDAVLSVHGDLVSTIQAEYFGDIHIYRLHW